MSAVRKVEVAGDNSYSIEIAPGLRKDGFGTPGFE